MNGKDPELELGEYQKVLGEASRLLLKGAGLFDDCAKLLSDEGPEPVGSKPFVPDVEDVIDTTALAMNDEYLSVLKTLKSYVIYDMNTNEIARRVVRRSEEAKHAASDLKHLLEVYQPSIEEKLPRISSRSTVIRDMVSEYQIFCQNLFKVGDPDADAPNSKFVDAQLAHMSFARDANEEDFDDMEIEENFIPICPLSSLPFQNPVKSLTCGHYFSEKNLYAALGSAPSITCPSRGCSKLVHKGELVRDPLMDIKTRLWSRQEERKRAAETQVMETL